MGGRGDGRGPERTLADLWHLWAGREPDRPGRRRVQRPIPRAPPSPGSPSTPTAGGCGGSGGRSWRRPVGAPDCLGCSTNRRSSSSRPGAGSSTSCRGAGTGRRRAARRATRHRAGRGRRADRRSAAALDDRRGPWSPTTSRGCTPGLPSFAPCSRAGEPPPADPRDDAADVLTFATLAPGEDDRTRRGPRDGRRIGRAGRTSARSTEAGEERLRRALADCMARDGRDRAPRAVLGGCRAARGVGPRVARVHRGGAYRLTSDRPPIPTRPRGARSVYRPADHHRRPRPHRRRRRGSPSASPILPARTPARACPSSPFGSRPTTGRRTSCAGRSPSTSTAAARRSTRCRAATLAREPRATPGRPRCSVGRRPPASGSSSADLSGRDCLVSVEIDDNGYPKIGGVMAAEARAAKADATPARRRSGRHRAPRHRGRRRGRSCHCASGRSCRRRRHGLRDATPDPTIAAGYAADRLVRDPPRAPASSRSISMTRARSRRRAGATVPRDLDGSHAARRLHLCSGSRPTRCRRARGSAAGFDLRTQRGYVRRRRHAGLRDHRGRARDGRPDAAELAAALRRVDRRPTGARRAQRRTPARRRPAAAATASSSRRSRRARPRRRPTATATGGPLPGAAPPDGDRHPSLDWREDAGPEAGGCCVVCRSGGCTAAEIVAALGFGRPTCSSVRPASCSSMTSRRRRTTRRRARRVVRDRARSVMALDMGETWAVRPWLPSGALVVLTGKVKEAGKSTLRVRDGARGRDRRAVHGRAGDERRRS